MSESSGDSDAESRIRALVGRAVEELSAADARDEALADYLPGRRVMGIMRRPSMKPRGRVWRLGVLLVAPDGALYETGLTTRALPPGRPAYQSESAEVRRAYRDAAHRGPFAAGETVNFDATPIDLEVEALRSVGTVLFLRGDEPMVRWSRAAGEGAAMGLEDYLADQVALLAHPPEGA